MAEPNMIQGLLNGALSPQPTVQSALQQMMALSRGALPSPGGVSSNMMGMPTARAPSQGSPLQGMGGLLEGLTTGMPKAGTPPAGAAAGANPLAAAAAGGLVPGVQPAAAGGMGDMLKLLMGAF